MERRARGQTRKAGPGRRVEAGMGSRRGVWQNFDVSDRLLGTNRPHIYRVMEREKEGS